MQEVTSLSLTGWRAASCAATTLPMPAGRPKLPPLSKRKKQSYAPLQRRKVGVFEHEERLSLVSVMLLEGASERDIETNMAKEWGLTEAGVHNYIAQARRHIQVYADEIRSNRLSTAVSQRIHLYRQTVKKQDFRTALEILKDLEKLLDLYPTEKMLNFNFDLTKLSDDQLRRLEKGESLRSVLGNKSPVLMIDAKSSAESDTDSGTEGT